MFLRLAGRVALVAGPIAALLIYLLPTVAALGALAQPHDDVALSSRRLLLLLRGFWISSAAALLACVLGGMLAAGLNHPSRVIRRGMAVVCLTTVLIPPYIYAYAWSFAVLPAGLPTAGLLAQPALGWLATQGRAIVSLGGWLAPCAAAILALGWRAAGAHASRLASLDASPAQALRHAAMPVMAPWCAAAFLICTALASTEFSVCHLSLVQTLNTEILAETQNLRRSGQAFRLAWPLMLPAMLLLAGLWWLRAPLLAALEARATLRVAVEEAGLAPRARHALWPALCAASILIAPLALLVWQFREPAALWRAFRTFPHAWPDGLIGAGGAAITTLLLAIGLQLALTARARTLHALALAVAASASIFALAPPVLIGDAFAAAYSDRAGLRDSIYLVSLVGVARFGFIALALAALASRTLARETQQAAQVDRAEAAQRYFLIHFPQLLPSLLQGAALVGVLTLGEVAASQLVVRAGVQNVAITLLNQIHFGRNDDVIAMALHFAALAVALAWLLTRNVRSDKPRN